MHRQTCRQLDRQRYLNAVKYTDIHTDKHKNQLKTHRHIDRQKQIQWDIQQFIWQTRQIDRLTDRLTDRKTDISKTENVTLCRFQPKYQNPQYFWKHLCDPQYKFMMRDNKWFWPRKTKTYFATSITFFSLIILSLCSAIIFDNQEGSIITIIIQRWFVILFFPLWLMWGCSLRAYNVGGILLFLYAELILIVYAVNFSL